MLVILCSYFEFVWVFHVAYRLYAALLVLLVPTWVLHPFEFIRSIGSKSLFVVSLFLLCVFGESSHLTISCWDHRICTCCFPCISHWLVDGFINRWVGWLPPWSLRWLTKRLTEYLVDWLDRLSDWLIDWLIDRLTDWLIDTLFWIVLRWCDWSDFVWLSVGRLFDWSIDRLMDPSIYWLIEWLTHWYIYCLFDGWSNANTF